MRLALAAACLDLAPKLGQSQSSLAPPAPRLPCFFFGGGVGVVHRVVVVSSSSCCRQRALRTLIFLGDAAPCVLACVHLHICLHAQILFLTGHPNPPPKQTGQEPFMRYLMPLLERFLLPDPAQPDPVKVRLHILQRLAVIGAWLPSLQVRVGKQACGTGVV